VRFHRSISKLFEEKGEDGFRRMEYNMLHEVGEFEDVLISVGGGTPCFFDNIDYMNACGTTIYLKVPIDELARRLEHNTYARPVLRGYAGDDLRTFISNTLTQREPFYTRSQLTLDAARLDTTVQIRQLVEQFTNKMHII
jgi:shikimate kinase